MDESEEADIPVLADNDNDLPFIANTNNADFSLLTNDEKGDLPLMANIDKVAAKHYSINLNCDLEKKIFYGDVSILVEIGESCEEIIFDCCDISIKEISEVVSDKVNSNQEKLTLAFSQTNWAVTIQYPPKSRSTSSTGSIGTVLLEIVYETLPETRSLHWRLDKDDNICVYTPASAVNNRGIFPCQDVPGAMSTWDFTLGLPINSKHKVFTTGDNQGKGEESKSQKQYKFHTSMVLPMSTFAIAIGDFEVFDISCDGLPVRLIGCHTDLSAVNPLVHQYMAAALQAATDILGLYPLPKLDIVIVSQYFSGLGLASPNLMFLSPTVLLGDTSFLIKISHEICHTWFGILVGAKDWSEVWLSEGFATFLEDFVHQKALLRIGEKTDNSLVKLRAYMKYKGLCSEVNNVPEKLQELRPMKGKKLVDENKTEFVLHGLDPEAGLTQSHYTKGFFMLHYLMQLVTEQKFLNLMKIYFLKYKGELVDSTYFLSMYFEEFNGCTNETQESIMKTWLDSSQLPEQLINSVRIHQCHDLPLFKDILDARREIVELIKKKAFKEEMDLLATELAHSEQVVILFDLLLESKLNAKVMKLLKRKYDVLIQTNPDIQHLWCELIIINKTKYFYQDIMDFLLKHPSMGVYLYSELGHSRSPVLVQMLETIVSEVKKNLDPTMKSNIENLIKIDG